MGVRGENPRDAAHGEMSLPRVFAFNPHPPSLIPHPPFIVLDASSHLTIAFLKYDSFAM